MSADGGGLSGNTGLVSANTPDLSGEPALGDFRSTIPEAYQEAPYLKDVNSNEDLHSKLAGAMKLIGAKQEIKPPTADSTPEDLEAFYNQLRPAAPGDYVLPMDGKEGTDAEFTGKIKEMFHKAGLTPFQASNLQEGFDALVAELNPDAKAAQQDVDFDKLAQEMFGDSEAQVMATAKELIAKYTQEGMQEHVKNLSSENLVVLAGVLNGIHKEFIAEDGAGMQKTGTLGAPPTSASIQNERIEILSSEAWTDEWHPQHAEAQARLDRLREQEMKLG